MMPDRADMSSNPPVFAGNKGVVGDKAKDAGIGGGSKTGAPVPGALGGSAGTPLNIGSDAVSAPAVGPISHPTPISSPSDPSPAGAAATDTAPAALMSRQADARPSINQASARPSQTAPQRSGFVEAMALPSSLADVARDVAEIARQTSEHLVEEVRHTAETLIEEQRDRAVGTVQDMAGALRKGAEALHGQKQELVAGYADLAADHVERFGDAMSRQSLPELVSETESFARRQPELFLAGAAIAGFMLGRFVRASGDAAGRANMAGANQMGRREAM